MTIYVDIIWLLNWLFDCLLLYWTTIILKRRVKVWRLIVGGLIGSLIIVVAFTPYYALADNIFMKLLISVFMILAVFGYIRWKLFMKSLMTLYFVTFSAGGILLGLHYLFSFQVAEMTTTTQMGMNRFGDPMSWFFVVFGFPLAWQFSKRTIDGMEMTKLHYEKLVKVSIQVDNFKQEFQGLIDSGNQLYDPLSRSPVMIVSIVGHESEVPSDMLELFEDPDKLLEEKELVDYTWAERIRVIPCKVVGKNHQLLTALKPDQLRIYHEGKEYQVNKGLVSFTLQQLSAENTYQCIVHPKMLTGIPVPDAS